MDEKAKRKEKSKHQAVNPVFALIMVALVLMLVISASLVLYLATMPDPVEIAFEKTVTAITNLNITAMTHISASATAAVPLATASEIALQTKWANDRVAVQTEISITAAYRANSTQRSEDMTQSAIQQTAVYSTTTAVYELLVANQTASSQNLTQLPISVAKQTATALAQLFSVSPIPRATAGFCGYTIYSGTVEVPTDSAEWRVALDRNSAVYRSARVLYDAFEAQNNCQGGLIPVPYQCLTMEITVDISPQEWGNYESLVNHLIPIIRSIGPGNICNTQSAQLRIYFFVTQNEFYFWEVGRTALIDGYRNGLRGEALWALGTVTEGR